MERELQKYRLVTVKVEVQPLRERGAGPFGRPLLGPYRQEEGRVHASAGRGGMVVPAFRRLVATCCLLQASSLVLLTPGRVVFSVSLYFIGKSPAM